MLWIKLPMTTQVSVKSYYLTSFFRDFQFNLVNIASLRQEFTDFKLTVDAIATNLEAIQQDLAKTKQDLLPPVGTIMGWLPKLLREDEPVVELPEGKIRFWHLDMTNSVLFCRLAKV